MRYSAAVLIAVLGLFFAFMGGARRYQLLLSLNRFVRGGDILNYETLRAENTALKSALSLARPAINTAPQKEGALIFADVFAAYPFTGRSSVRVTKGAIDGMRVGYPATFGGSVLVGQVTEVHNRYSIVRMVGSPEWQIPVRVGPHKVAGLLVGGTIPRISMLAADKSIVVGDVIIAASNDLPYGLVIGTVSSLSTEAMGGVFKDAVVTFSYDARDVAELAFMVWTPD
jgi:cell shape-determining protein MreC